MLDAVEGSDVLLIFCQSRINEKVMNFAEHLPGQSQKYVSENYYRVTRSQ